MKSPKKRILFITQLEIWSMTTIEAGATMGNQSIYSTMLGYVRNGYEVHLLTSSERLKGPLPLPKEIIVHRHPMPGRPVVRGFRKIRNLLDWGSKRSSQSKSENTIQTDLDYKKYRVLHLVLVFYLWMSFWTLLLSLRHRFSAYYGYEMFGVPVAWFWGRFFGRGVVSRFQGTLMSKYVNDVSKLRYNWTHTMPMRLPTDLLVMANDGTQGDLVLDVLGVPKSRYVFWRNGVAFEEKELDPDFDPTKFRAQNGYDADTVLFLNANRMVYWKRLERLVNAVALVPKDRKFKVLLIGDGSEKPGLEELAHKLGVEDRIDFLGIMEHRHVLDWQRAADSLIGTSDFTNAANQMIEAQKLGVPYIAVDTGDTSRLLEHEVNGLLVKEPDDYQGIADAMTRLIDAPELRRKLAEGALEVGRKKILTWPERMNKEVAELEKRLGLNYD